MVEAAKENARRLGFEVSGRVADAERLPYEDDTFDVVVGHAVIHHIPDVELAFREMLRYWPWPAGDRGDQRLPARRPAEADRRSPRAEALRQLPRWAADAPGALQDRPAPRPRRRGSPAR